MKRQNSEKNSMENRFHLTWKRKNRCMHTYIYILYIYVYIYILYTYMHIYIYIYMRIVKQLVPQIVKGLHIIICQQLFFWKLGVWAISKTRSPGRFPEGKVGDSGRLPGRCFHKWLFLVRNWFHVGPRRWSVEKMCQIAMAQLPGRNPERFPEGKSDKVVLGSQRARPKTPQCSPRWPKVHSKIAQGAQKQCSPKKSKRGTIQSPKHVWALQSEFEEGPYAPKLPINSSSGDYVKYVLSHMISRFQRVDSYTVTAMSA